VRSPLGKYEAPDDGTGPNSAAADKTRDHKETSTMLGYAILGCGYVAERHVRAAVNLPDTRVAALCDRDQAAATRLAEKYELDCPILPDFRDGATRDDVDVVVVGLPTPLHCEACSLAAAAGKHIYMEKPLAQTMAEADEMIATCERANVKMVVGHSHRYFPVLQRAREKALSGAIGRIVKVRCVLCYYNDFSSESREWKLDAGTELHGALLDVGVHAADDIHFVCDSRTVRLYAEGGCSRPEESPMIDLGVAVMRLENGAVAELEVSETQPTGGKFPCQGTTEVYGTRGSLLIDGSKLTTYIAAQGDEPESFEEESLPAAPSFLSSWENLHRDFVGSILEDRPVPIPAEAGRRSLQVVDAIFRSIRQHRAVELA